MPNEIDNHQVFRFIFFTFQFITKQFVLSLIGSSRRGPFYGFRNYSCSSFSEKAFRRRAAYTQIKVIEFNERCKWYRAYLSHLPVQVVVMPLECGGYRK